MQGRCHGVLGMLDQRILIKLLIKKHATHDGGVWRENGSGFCPELKGSLRRGTRERPAEWCANPASADRDICSHRIQ